MTTRSPWGDDCASLVFSYVRYEDGTMELSSEASCSHTVTQVISARGPRRQAIETAVEQIRHYRPAQVFIEISGTRHRLSDETVKNIINREASAADVAVG